MHFMLRKNHEMKKYFKHFSFKEIRKSAIKKIINLGFPSAMQMLFEVTLFTAAIWLSGSIGKNHQAANQIALTLATTTFMFAMGLNVTAMIRVSNQKGLNDYKNLIIVAKSIFILAIILETIFALVFIVFHNFLPHLFLNMNDANQALDNIEIIKITAQLLLVAAIFSNFRRNTSSCSRRFAWFARCKNPNVYNLYSLLGGWFSYFFLFRIIYKSESNRNLDRAFGRINGGCTIFVYSFS